MSKKSEEEKKVIPSKSTIEATDCTKSKSGTQHDSTIGTTQPVDGTTGTTQPPDGDVFKKMAQEEEDIYGGTTDEDTGKIKMLLMTVIIL